jgi:hypothetical protein
LEPRYTLKGRWTHHLPDVSSAPLNVWLANCYFSTPKHCYIPSQRARIALVVVDLKGIRAG